MRQDSEKMTEEDLGTLIQQEMSYTIGGSDGTTDSELTNAWDKALEYYFGKPRGDEIPGRSHVISMDMADMIEQTLAQVLPAFDKKNLGIFYGPNEKTAQIESDAVNYVILQQNNGFVTFLQALKDVFLQRNGIVKIYVDERTEVEEQTFENVPPEILP